MMREELSGRQIAESLMRADVIVDVFPLSLGRAQRREIKVARVRLVELFRVGAIGAFHVAVELGRVRRQHKQTDAPLLTGLFKGGGEFTAAIDLNGTDRHGHPPRERGEELGGRHTGGATIGLDHVPPSDDIAGGKLFQDHARQGPHIERIDLDQIAGMKNGIVAGFAHRIGSGTGPATDRDGAPERLNQLPGGPQPGQYTIDGLPERVIPSRRKRIASFSRPQRGYCCRS